VQILGRRALPGSRKPVAIAALLVLLSATPVVADGDIPPERQALILVRALAYDNNLKARAGDSVLLAVVFRPGNTQSEAASDGMVKAFRALESVKVQQLPFRAIALAYTGKGALKSAVTAQGIDVLYICSGLDADLASIKELSRHDHILTMGAKEEFIANGLSLGVFVVDSKNTVTVNLSASREEGVAFGADLLRIGRVIR
jgi:hypothetical protein